MSRIIDSSLTVAVDLGGTNIRAAVVDRDGCIVKQIRQKVDTSEAEPSIVPSMIQEVMQDVQASKAVVGIPGIVDYELQKTVFYPNLPQSWISKLSSQWIGDRAGVEVNLANDADLAAVGESKFGAGKVVNDLVYVTISTGIGGAAILRRKLVHGKYSANDIGHTIIDLPAAGLGRRYTPETYGSGPSLVVAAAEAGLDVSSEELVERVRVGDVAAVKVWESSIAGAAAGIVNLAWLYAPQMVVIGGGVGLNADLVHPVIEKSLAAYGPAAVGSISVEAATLGDSAALVGAAAWWEYAG